MSKKLIITISRQYGSGGREIGEIIAKKLNIPIYDKEIITDAASKGNFCEDVIRKSEALLSVSDISVCMELFSPHALQA